MANKDFLSSLTAEENKPESFKEEKRIKVEKPKVKIPGWLIGTVIGVIVLIIALVIWIIAIPHIPMENFVGKTTKDAQSYLTQYKVDPQGIRFEEEYNFDYDAGQIISQSVSADKKIKKNSVITFVVSKGADPEETIKVPDLETMTKSEIQKWIDNNKLSNTKISVSYSDEVEKDAVISLSFKNDDRDEFKRSSQLTINVSKGAAPAAEVKVTDFKDKTYAEVEAFAKEKKLKIQKTEILSTEVEKGLVCYTKPAANEKIKEGETLTVYISKGKATVLPDLVDKTTDDYSIWKMGKGKDVVTYEKYVTTTDESLDKKIKEQSPAAGTKVTDEVFVVTIYKYVEEEQEVVTPVEYDTLDVSKLLGMTVDQANSYLGSLKNKGVKVEKDNAYTINVSGYKAGQIYFIEDDALVSNNYVLSKAMTLKVRVSAGQIFDLKTGVDGFTTLADLVRYLSEQGFEITYGENASYLDATQIEVVGTENKFTVDSDNNLSGEPFQIIEGQKIKITKTIEQNN